MYVETYPNDGPLWPCGCLMGNPDCRCGADDKESESEVQLCMWCDAPVHALAETLCPTCGCPWDGD